MEDNACVNFALSPKLFRRTRIGMEDKVSTGIPVFALSLLQYYLNVRT